MSMNSNQDILHDTPTLNSIMDTFNDITSSLQNILWTIGIVIFLMLVILSVFSIRRRTKQYSEKQIEELKRSGKFIPGLFVELNESKDVFRFFLFGKKWKERIIHKYNVIYDNFYGQILKQGNIEPEIIFRLHKFRKLRNVEKAIDTAKDYHERFSRREIKLKKEYEESEPLFEIIHYLYTEALEELQHYAKAANSNYLVLTGSAGNGKTNLLCSIAELVIKLNRGAF